MKFEKYTKEILEEAIKQSVSFSHVLRILNIPYTSGNHRHIKSRIEYYNLNTSHFLGNKVNSGENHKGGSDKLSPESILVFDRLNGRREHVHRLKRALIELGVEEKCNKCGTGVEWNNEKLVLQIDHINGNGVDNRLENLRFLCPNCHSQTETFGTRNAHYEPKIKIIENIIKPNIHKISKEELEKLIWEKPTTKIAKQFGVSDKTIEKWAKSYGLNKPPRGYWSKLRSQSVNKMI